MKALRIRPKYSFKTLSDVILLSLGMLIAIIFNTMRFCINLEVLSMLILLIGFCIWWTHSLIRCVIFDSSTFIVERYILPPMIINYADVVDIGVSKIKTKLGEVSLAGMVNADEITYKFNDLIHQGKINPEQLENKMLTKEIVWRKSIFPTLIISLPLLVMLFYLWPFDNMWFNSLGIGIGSGLILFFVASVVQWVVKKNLIKDKAD
jgi:hypothetical protein